MADLDNLQIQITASTKPAVHAIEYLRQELGRLNAALSNYGADSTYIKGLKNLATGFDSISNSVAELDVERLTSVSKAIGELATKGAKLSNLSFVKTFSDMGAASERASAKTKKMVDEISKTFNITSKQGVSELTDSVNKFYSSMGDDSALKKASDDVKSVITQYAELDKVIDGTYKSVRDWLSHTQFAIPKGATNEFLDDFKEMRGILGLKNTTTDASSAVGFDSAIAEMNDKLGTNFNVDNVVDGMREVVDFLREGRDGWIDYEKQERNAIAASEEMSNTLDRLYESINKVRDAGSNVDENGFLLGGDLDGVGFDLTEADLGPIEEESNKVVNSLNDIQQEVRETQELANPFEGIVKGLGTLQGINITADQFAGIRVLADSLGKLVGSNGEKAGIILPQIASGLAAMAGIHIPDNATQLAALGQAVGAFGSKAATRAQGLPQLVEGLRQLQYVKIPDVSGVYDLAAALSKLGGAKIEVAIQNMPRLTAAFTDMIAAISAAPTVSAETVQLAQAMAQLATASRTAGQATQKSSTGINLLRGAVSAALPTFKKAQHHTFSLAAAFGKLYASYFLVIRGVRKLGEAMSIASQLTEVQNVVAATFGDMSYKLDDFADKAIYDFGMAELSARKFASRYQAMGTSMGITDQQVAEANEFLTKTLEGQKREIDGVEDNYADLGDTLADMSINITKLAGDYASFFEADIEDVADDMRSILTGMAKPLYDYGISLREADIKEWALKNGLDANIRSMNNAQKTMLRYQYVMANSAKVMNDYQITMNSWANVLRTIRQQFVKFGSIIGEGLINTFKPLLIKFREFMNTLIDLTQKALNAIGKLLGWQIEIEEVGVAMDEDMSNYADSVGDAADNAKKLNAQLRSIDELNNLTTPKDNDNGGGGSGISGAGGGQSKATGGGWKVLPYESDIESWFDLGSRIRDKILNAFESINWDEIQSKVKENAKNLVDLLKGLLVPDDEGNTIGGAVGEFLAQCINTGFDWLVTTTGDMELWGAAGTNIADFFLKFFENLDVEDMAETINNIVEGLKTMITTAAEKLNTPENRKMISDKIKTFFESIEPDTWGTIALVLGTITVAKVTSWYISTVVKQGFADFLIKEFGEASITSTISVVPKFAIGATAATVGGTSAGVDIGSVLFGEETYEDYQGLGGLIQLLVDLKDAIEDLVNDDQLKFDWGNFWTDLGDDFKNSSFYGWFFDTDLGKTGEMSPWLERTFKSWTGISPEKIIGTDKGNNYNKKYWAGWAERNRKSWFDIPMKLGGGEPNKYWEKWGENNTNYWQKWAENNKKSWIDNPKQFAEEFFGEGSLLYESVVRPFKEMGEDSATNYADGLNGQMELESPAMNVNMGMFGAGAGTALSDGMSIGLTLIGDKISTWWNENVAPWFTQEKWAGLGANISAGLTLKWTEFTAWWQNTGLYDWWTNKVMPWFTRERWDALGDNIRKGISDKWNELVTWWQNTALVKWWNENVQPWFTYERWNALFDNVKRALTDAFRAGANGAIGYLNDMIGGVETSVNDAIDGLNALIDLAQKIPGVSLILSDVGHIQLPRIQYFANGGFPNPGSLFVAGEAGAEMLGTMNGRTTVASNGEITGISDTIRSTSAEEIQLLRQQNQLLQGILQKEFGISNGDIFRSVRTSAAEYTKMTGNPAF